MDIEVIEERDNDVLVLLPVDRIDSTNARAFESIVMEHISKGELRMIIDFGRLNFISSSGLRVLLIATKKLSAAQGKLVLCDMQEHIHEVCMISGFDQLIPIHDSRKASMNLFLPPPNPCSGRRLIRRKVENGVDATGSMHFPGSACS